MTALLTLNEPGIGWVTTLAVSALGGFVKSTFGGTCLAGLMMEWPSSGQGKSHDEDRRPFATIEQVKARRSPWINGRTKLLLIGLQRYDFTLPEDVARQLISDHLDGVAERMRIGRQAARYYVTDEVIQKIVDQLV